MFRKKKIKKSIVVILILLLTTIFPINLFAKESGGPEDLISNEIVTNTSDEETSVPSPVEEDIQVNEKESLKEDKVDDSLVNSKGDISLKASTPMPFSLNGQALKTQIEQSTGDLTLQLDPGIYEIESEILNGLPIKVKLVGAVDGNGQPSTQFKMADGVSGNPRFIRLEGGTLELSNINLTGTKGLNGGVSAKNVQVDNCIFKDNYTEDGVSGGGAIRVKGGYLNVESCTFTGNSVGIYGDGGAISSEYSGNITINNAVFDSNERIGNQNQYGGAISVKQPGVPNTKIEITNSIFTNNVLDGAGSWTTGGAIRIFGTNQLESVRIDNVLFKGNVAKRSFYNNGGAIAFMTTNQSTISNCTFINNSAGKYGGAIYYENSVGKNEIINSTFVGNKASFAGSGVSAYSSQAKIDSGTLIGNNVSTHGNNSKLEISNSIITGNGTLGSSTVNYTGTNLARMVSGDSPVNASDVLTHYTSDSLVEVNKSNFVAPVIINGPAYKKISGTRALGAGQNGLTRKTPLSDIGAYEAANYYQVTFDTNGGSDVPSQLVEAGSLATLPTDPEKDNLVFSGWYTDNDTFQNSWDFGNQAVQENITLYAKWVEKTYILEFNLNGGPGTAPENQVLKKDQRVNSVEDPIWIGHTFKGWSRIPERSTEYLDLSSFAMPEENVILYAQWELNEYKVIFDSNGGSGQMENEPYLFGEKKALYENSFTREGYVFLGWSKEKSGSVDYQDKSEYTCEMATDLTLYAQWERLPIEPEKPNKGDEGSLSGNSMEDKTQEKTGLPKTGGITSSIIGMILLLSGIVMVTRKKRISK